MSKKNRLLEWKSEITSKNFSIPAMILDSFIKKAGIDKTIKRSTHTRMFQKLWHEFEQQVPIPSKHAGKKSSDVFENNITKMLSLDTSDSYGTSHSIRPFKKSSADDQYSLHEDIKMILKEINWV